MTENRVSAPLLGGLGLLERAIGYTLGSLQLVTSGAMGRATPCAAWDLQALLQHMNDSLRTLHEAVDVGHVRLATAHLFADPAEDPVAALRNRACTMLGAWTNADEPVSVSVAGLPVTAGVVTATGALEIAVHGWDVAQACGQARPLPTRLAEELLPLAEILVTGTDRPCLFALPVATSSFAGPGDQLLAFLGRQPLPG